MPRERSTGHDEAASRRFRCCTAALVRRFTLIFVEMTLEEALEEFDQIYQLNEGDRMRDLVERLGEDGTRR